MAWNQYGGGLKGTSLGWRWELTGGLEAGLVSCQNERMRSLPLIQFTTRNHCRVGAELVKAVF